MRSACGSSPAIVDNIAYASAYNGKVYAFGLRTFHLAVAFGDNNYPCSIVTNSMITNFTFSQPHKLIRFNIDALAESNRHCNVTLPQQLLGGPYTVLVDGNMITPLTTTNTTHTVLAFTYAVNASQIEIIGTTVIPETPIRLILLLGSGIAGIVVITNIIVRSRRRTRLHTS
jgi:hypothetical protein